MTFFHFVDVVSVGATTSITGNSVWGVLRGLETFSQILYPSPQGGEVSNRNGSKLF